MKQLRNWPPGDSDKKVPTADNDNEIIDSKAVLNNSTFAERARGLSLVVNETQEVLGAEKAVTPEKEVNKKMVGQQEKMRPAKEAMNAAEAEFLKEYTEFYSFKGANKDNESEALESKRLAFNTARLAYANALTESAAERLAARDSRGGVIDAATQERHTKILNRYNRLVRYQEIIKPVAEHKNDARVEALAAREKGMFMKGVKWFGEQNQKLEKTFGKTGSRVIRAAGATLAAGTLGALTGAFASVGAVGVAGWGAFRLGKALANSVAGAGIGMTTGEITEFFARFGQRSAEQKLRTVGRTGDVLTIDELEKYDEAREELEKTADERTIQNKKMVGRVIGALVGGAGLSSLENLGEAWAHTPGGSGSGSGGGGHMGSEAAGAKSGAVLGGSSTESAKAAAAAAAEKSDIHMVTGATIHHPGEGSNQAFIDLKAKVGEASLFKGAHSPALKHLLETHPNDLSREMGSAFGERGMVMHKGDSFFVDERENVYFQPMNGKEQLFIENKIDGSGFIVHHDIHGTPLPPAEAPHTVPHARVHAAPEAARPTPAPVPHHEAPAAQTPPPYIPPAATPSTPEPLPPPNVTPEAGTSHVDAVPSTPNSAAPAVETPPTPAAPAHVEAAAPAPNGTPETLPAPTSSVAAPESAPSPAPVHAPVPESGVAASIPNKIGVPIYTNEVHLYGAPDPDAPGKDSLILYVQNLAANKENLFKELDKIAPSNLGKTIYFQSPEPMIVNGVETPWIATAHITETGQVLLSPLPDPMHPEFVGGTLNPDIFTKIIS